MPLYEYQCTACGHRFEKIQKFSAPPVHECPECGQEARRMVSSPAFQFKGSGWYITDYARSGKSGEAGEGGTTPAKTAEKSSSDKSSSDSASSASGSSGATGGDKKTDTKPAPAKAD